MKTIQIFLLSFIFAASAFAEDLKPLPAKDTLGEQRIAVILVDFIGDVNKPSREEVNEAFFNTQYSIDRFYREGSYERAWLTGKVYGWYKGTPVEGKCFLTSDEIFKMVNKDMDLKKVDRFVVLNYQKSENCRYSGLGESSHGKITMKSPQGNVYASLANIVANNNLGNIRLPYGKRAHITSTVVAHELGHSFGIFGHANLFDCDKNVFSKDSVGCVQEAIADMHSMMGGEGFFRSSLHFNACHKEELHWFNSSEIKTISTEKIGKGSVVEFDLFPYEKSADGYLTAKIELENPIKVVDNGNAKVYMKNLFLEYRTPQGFNVGLQDLIDKPLDRYNNLTFDPGYYGPDSKVNVQGVWIRGGFYNQGRCTTTYLIDTKPNSLRHLSDEYSLYDALDGMLTVGKSIEEPNNQIKIEVVQVNQNGSLRVRVSK